MSNTVSGGKVWSVPTPQARKSEFSGLLLCLIAFLPMWVAIAISAFHLSRKTFTFEVVQLPVYGTEYGEQVEIHGDFKYLYLAVGLGAVGWVITTLVKRLINIGFTTDYAVSMLMLIGLATTLLVTLFGMLTPVAEEPKSFEEWAQKTYGYSSIEKYHNGETTKTFNVIKENGEKIQVRAYEDGKYMYLYENIEQLKAVFDEVIKKKEALGQ